MKSLISIRLLDTRWQTKQKGKSLRKLTLAARAVVVLRFLLAYPLLTDIQQKQGASMANMLLAEQTFSACY